jgi:hypothetical protein
VSGPENLMSHGKSKNEDEYFAKRDAELIRTTREIQIHHREETERAKHIGKCPRCGHDLTKVKLHHVEVDICPKGHGTWLDAGELERIMKHEEPSLLRRVFDDVTSGIRGHQEKA